VVVVPGAAGQASVFQPSVVSPRPASYTPVVLDDPATPPSAVYAFAQVGSTMYAGGAITTVQNAARTRTFSRHNLFAFNATTGAILAFAPVFDGPVWTITASPGGRSLFIGGEFSSVNGIVSPGLVRYDLAAKRFDPGFAPALNGSVTDSALVGGRLMVAGSFPAGLAALNPATGADTGYVNLALSGTSSPSAGPTRVYRFAVNPAGDRIVAIGNFTAVSGSPRAQAFMVLLGATATLGPWHAPRLDLACTSSHPAYLRDVDFSPDGTYFAMVATGGGAQGTVGFCDAAGRWEANDDPNAEPTWINWTGGDSLYSVAATGAAVYVGGHQRWLDNPFGNDSAGPGAVPRPGIGAIDPVTGQALDWNPTKTRRVGAQALYATATGLWVGSDGELFAGEFHKDIAFCPL